MTPVQFAALHATSRKNCDDAWVNLYPTHSKEFRAGVLNSCPDFTATPPTNISCPDGLNEVNKRLWSKDERINDAEKSIELQDLRDFVFRKRTDHFHWKMANEVETEHKRTSAQSKEAHRNDQAQPSASQMSDHNDSDAAEIVPVPNQNGDTQINARMPAPDNSFDYDVGSFVLVRNGEDVGVSNKSFGWLK